MNTTLRLVSGGMTLLVAMSLAGCGGADATPPNSAAGQHDHDHSSHGEDRGHVHAESYAEALTQVEKLQAEVKAAFSADELSKADGPVHEIGHLLEALPDLARKESLSELDRQQVENSAGALMDRFGELDERIHGGSSAGKAYDEVASSIAEAMATLKSISIPEQQP